MSAMLDLVERCVRYMAKVECWRCGEAVYGCKDDARNWTKHWAKNCDLETSRISKT